MVDMSTNKSDYGCKTMLPYEKTTKIYLKYTDMQFTI